MLVADETALAGLYFVGMKHVPDASKRWKLNEKDPLLLETAKQLQEYFETTRRSFSIPLRFDGTNFQQRIWREIASIPYAKTINYSELANRAGAPAAIRAAGTTTGKNPISIIVPCHRVMGKSGGLCGFAGGLERKRYLLELEGMNGSFRSNGR